MRDTLRMWRMMRLLKENQHDWARSDYVAKRGETDEQREGRFVMQLMETAKRKGDPEVLLILWCTKYISRYEKKEPDFKWQTEKGMRSLSQAMSIAFSCEEKKYWKHPMRDDVHDSQYVQITLAGKKFSEVEGLLKVWVTEDIGVLLTLALTIIGTVGALNLRWFGNVIETMSAALYKAVLLIGH